MNLIRCAFLATQLVFGAALAEDCEVPAHVNHLRFEDFPARQATIKRPVKPRLASEAAKNYRTRIREGAKEAPSFAGNVIVTAWGCGTNCSQSAFINAETGYVWVAPFYETPPLPSEMPDRDAGTFFCLTSKLYVVSGSHDDGRTIGVYYYLWTGRELKLIKTAPYRRSES